MAALAGAADHCASIDLLRRAGHGLRRQALRDQVEDAGVGQIAVERGVEGRLQRRGLGIVAHRLEVRRGDANALVAQIGAGVDPVLRRQRCGAKITR